MFTRFLFDAMLRQVQIGSHGPIRIASFADNQVFAQVVRSALKFLGELNPAKSARVEMNIRWIVDISRPGGAGAMEFHRHGYCFYDFVPDDTITSLERDAIHAGLFVHESTHGMLFARGIPYNEHTRVRVERICTAAENSLYREIERRHPGLGEPLIQPFNPANWRALWTMSRVERLTATLSRIEQRTRNNSTQE